MGVGVISIGSGCGVRSANRDFAVSGIGGDIGTNVHSAISVCGRVGCAGDHQIVRGGECSGIPKTPVGSVRRVSDDRGGGRYKTRTVLNFYTGGARAFAVDDDLSRCSDGSRIIECDAGTRSIARCTTARCGQQAVNDFTACVVDHHVLAGDAGQGSQ